jgi:hypothetical protein
MKSQPRVGTIDKGWREVAYKVLAWLKERGL